MVMLLMGIWACQPPEAVVPRAEEVEGYYEVPAGLTVEMVGNVAELTVRQPTGQLRRGGTLWAKVGPYVYLFSQETQSLFRDFNGLAGVRVVTTTPAGREVARAFLTRDTLNDLTWRRSLNVSGRARAEGTQHPSLLEDLIRWGEDHAEFEYNPRYVPR